jgi:hypothetical protein
MRSTACFFIKRLLRIITYMKLKLLGTFLLIITCGFAEASPDLDTTHAWIEKHLKENAIDRVTGDWPPYGLVGYVIAMKGDWEFFERNDEQCSLIISSKMIYYKDGKLINLENFPYQQYPKFISFLSDYAREDHHVIRFPSEIDFSFIEPHAESFDDGDIANHHNFSLKIVSPSVRFLTVKNFEALMKDDSLKRVWEERKIATNTISIPMRSRSEVERLQSALVNLNVQCEKISNAF